ncbi:MAG: hypothetical protein M3495_18295 [Pseudomonadota bacterium]|nr:hypothetical protein [Pseudomonadota bacterium]
MINVNELSVPDRWLLVVRGVAQLTVEDQEGRRIGPSRDPGYAALIENQIPGATYNPGQVFSSVFLMEPGIYTFKLIAKAPDRVHVSLSLFNAVGKLYAIFFQGVPLTERSQVQLVYDTADRSTMPMLALDRDGNGEIEQIQPTILSPQASNDIAPPTTQIEINDNVVTVSAIDNPGGAGVLRTYYTTDGITRSIYTEPFALPPDAKIVMAYSEDRAGNLEYPGAVRPVLGLSETHVVMKVRAGTQDTVQHTVDVVNLDPISVTGQLQWEALTDVPWLSVEPSAGTTPYPITLSMYSADLGAEPREAGVKGISGIAYEANVIVRSVTPGTVFAERILSVRVEVATAQRALKRGQARPGSISGSDA